MPAQVRALIDKISGWWNKFTARQKTLIVASTVAVVLTAVILAAVLTRTKYVHLYTAVNGTEAASVRDILREENLDFKVSPDGMSFSIKDDQQSSANLALGANKISADTWSIADVTSGGFSTTESDKQRRYVDYLEKKLAGDFIASFEAIKSAKVKLNIPENNGTLLASGLESSASIVLELTNPDAFTEDNAAYLARAVATALGNSTTDNVVIMDNTAKLLFSGGEEGTSASAASTLSYKAKAEQTVKNQVRSVLLGTGLFTTVDIGTNLNIDFSESKNTTHLYYAPEGQQQGMLTHQDNYSSENTANNAGVPGTDTNDETTYVTADNQNSSSSVEENSYDYAPNESITESKSWGVVNYSKSTIAVTATNMVVYNQSSYKASDNNGLSWAEYKAANSAPTAITDQELITQMRNLVSKATGISVENVELALYSENLFVDSAGLALGVTDILQIVMILAILAMLAFVIMRSMRSTRDASGEEPQELSVESLLESQNADGSLENIEVGGSETKVLIEKFIDENPEAAANLLRNWLNEGAF